MNEAVTHYWCSSPAITGEVVVKDGIVYQVPRAWYRWRGTDFEKFKRMCRVDRCEVMKDA